MRFTENRVAFACGLLVPAARAKMGPNLLNWEFHGQGSRFIMGSPSPHLEVNDKSGVGMVRAVFALASCIRQASPLLLCVSMQSRVPLMDTSVSTNPVANCSLREFFLSRLPRDELDCEATTDAAVVS